MRTLIASKKSFSEADTPISPTNKNETIERIINLITNIFYLTCDTKELIIIEDSLDGSA